MTTHAGKYRFVLLAMAVVSVDQWSKWWIEVNFTLHETREILPNLNLTRINNTGVAFGLLPARGNLWGTVLLTVLGLIALAVVLAFFLRAHRSERWLLGGLGLILGGAVGNLIDRIMSGAVTDFIDFYVGTYHWHTFNIADSAITVGIVLMLIDSFFAKGAPASPAEESVDAAAGDRKGVPRPVSARDEGAPSPGPTESAVPESAANLSPARGRADGDST